MRLLIVALCLLVAAYATELSGHTVIPQRVRSEGSERPMRLAEAKNRGFMDTLGSVVSSVAGAIGGNNAKQKPEDIEDCVACRYVWLQVEMDVGNSQIEENIYDSFTRNCIEAQKAPIFYPACQDMFDSVDDMISDYMDGYTVNQMCENSRICR